MDTITMEDHVAVLTVEKGSTKKPKIQLAKVEGLSIVSGRSIVMTDSVELHDDSAQLKLRFFQPSTQAGRHIVVGGMDAYTLPLLDTKFTNVSFPTTSVLFKLRDGLKRHTDEQHGVVHLLSGVDKELIKKQNAQLGSARGVKPVAARGDDGQPVVAVDDVQPLRGKLPAAILAPKEAVGRSRANVRKAGCTRRRKGAKDPSWG